MISNKQIKQILTVATHAISPYNTQPWRFKITDNGVDIFILRSKNFFLKLEGVLEFTLGALLENLVEGARSTGFIAQWDHINPIKDLDTPCVSVTFTQHKTKAYNIEHVLTRRTNRLPYSASPLSTEHQQLLQQLFDNKNIELIFLENREKNYMTEILEELELNRLSSAKMVDEMLNYIRISSNTDKNGSNETLLDINSLGLSLGTIQLIRRIKSNGLLRYFYNLIGAENKGKQWIRNLLDNSGAILVFNLIDRDYLSLVEAGQVIQRLLNEMEKLGIASMSYLSGIYLFDVLAENPEIFSKKEKDAILNCKWDMESLVAQNRQKVSFIVRAGYLNETAQVVKRRKAIDDLLL